MAQPTQFSSFLNPLSSPSRKPKIHHSKLNKIRIKTWKKNNHKETELQVCKNAYITFHLGKFQDIWVSILCPFFLFCFFTRVLERLTCCWVSPRRQPAVSSQYFFIIVIIVITFIIVISYYGKPCPTGVHRWQGGVTMVNKVLVAMETLFCSNWLVQMFEFWIAVPPHQSTWFVLLVALVVFWFFFFIYFFLAFCIFILIRCTVCGCILRLLVPFKIVSLTLKHVVRTQIMFCHTRTATENKHFTRGVWRMGFAEMRLISGGLPTVPDVSDLLVDACVIGCPPSFVHPLLLLSWEEGSIAQCIHGCSVATVCFVNLGDDRGPTEYFKDGTEK